MPTIITSGAATAKAFGFSLGGGGRYFCSLLTPVGGTQYSFGYNNISLNYSKNVINVVSYVSGGAGKFITSKISSINGALLSSSGVTPTSTDYINTAGQRTAVANTPNSTSNATDYIYIGVPVNTDTGNADQSIGQIIKIDSSGSIVATNGVDDIYGEGYFLYTIQIYGSDIFVYVKDFYYDLISYVLKYNTNLVLQNTYSFTNTALDIKQDANYLYTLSYGVGTGYYINLVAYSKSNPTIGPNNPSIAFTTAPAASLVALGLGFLDANNIYVLFQELSGSLKITSLALNTSSGSVNWAYTISGVTTVNITSGYLLKAPRAFFGFDSSNNIYIAYTIHNNSKTYIIKLSSAGAMVYTREFTCTTSGTTQTVQSFVVNGSTMYLNILLQNGSSTYNTVVKLPTDGTLTQSFTLNGLAFSYTSVAASVTSITLPPTFSYGGLSSGSITETSPSLTTATSTPTVSIKPL